MEMIMSKETIRPFANGSEFDDWRYRNCDNNCPNNFDWNKMKTHCIFEKEISRAYIDNGKADKKMAEIFVGNVDNITFLPDCKYKNSNFKNHERKKELSLEEIKTIFGVRNE